MLSKARKKGSRIVFLLIFLFGFGLSLYPFVGSWFMAHDQSNIVGTYTSDTKKLSAEDQKQILSDAENYNTMLYQTGGAVVGNASDNLTHENYEKLLDVSGNGIMATLEIPKIDVDLPVYHGTDDSVLSIGVGHLEGTSLPIGGTSTHAVLSGHRGLPSSKLFTRLDEIVIDDLFYIHVLDQTLAYQVDKIKVVEPDEVDALQIEADKDLVSLVTCTPYGLNTHRLIVTGHRVPYKEKQKEAIQQGIPSIRELIFIILPFIFLLILIGLIIAQKRKERNHEKTI